MEREGIQRRAVGMARCHLMLCKLFVVLVGMGSVAAGAEALLGAAVDSPKSEVESAKAENEHPLDPAIRWAKAGMKRMDRVKDYSATFIKRERIDGKLGEHQFMFLKVRHKPFSAYLYFLRPERLRGREVIYVDGRNDGKLFAHDVGSIRAALGTVSLRPKNVFAMQDNRYPITEIGIRNLAARMIERGGEDKQVPAPCEVTFYKGAKINDRLATCIKVVHPERHAKHTFYKALIYVDEELGVPVRYESYGWPEKAGEEPPLDEEYTYTRVRINQGFTDADFDPANPHYHFPDAGR